MTHQATSRKSIPGNANENDLKIRTFPQKKKLLYFSRLLLVGLPCMGVYLIYVKPLMQMDIGTPPEIVVCSFVPVQIFVPLFRVELKVLTIYNKVFQTNPLHKFHIGIQFQWLNAVYVFSLISCYSPALRHYCKGNMECFNEIEVEKRTHCNCGIPSYHKPIR